MDDVPTDVNLAVQIRAVASGNNQGRLVVYIDGELMTRQTGINLGFGAFDDNDRAETSIIGVKMGMYAYDTNDYDYNEVRMLYLDNVGVTAGFGGNTASFNRIDPRR